MKRHKSRLALTVCVVLGAMLVLNLVSTVVCLEEFLPAEETKVFDLVNAERQKAGVKTLNRDGRLDSAARKHSKEMAQLDYFAHESPTPGLEDVGKRVTAEGYVWIKVGENIFCQMTNNTENGRPAWVDADLAQKAVTEWLDSPGHKQNMLNGEFNDTGVGVFLGGGENTGYWTDSDTQKKYDWIVMFTQVFATPLKGVPFIIGGYTVPIDEFNSSDSWLAESVPLSGLALATIITTVATIIYVKRIRCRK